MHTIRELKIQDYYETRINHLKKCNKDLRKRLKEKDNIIKEIRKYIEENLFKDDNECGCWWYGFDYYKEAKKELLEILDKVGETDDSKRDV